MTSSDIMILAYPVIGAAVMGAAAVGMVFFFGYHRPVMRVGAANPSGGKANSDEPGDRPVVDGVLMRLTEFEAARLLAERAANTSRQPETATP